MLTQLGQGSVSFVLALVCTSHAAATDFERMAFQQETGGSTYADGDATSRLQRQASLSDTLSFGYVDGSGFAVEGDSWTFDHGGSDPLEGWYGTDITTQSTAYWRRITDSIWNADPSNTVSAPVLNGTGSAWCGAFGSEASDLCWEAGLGYGDSWCQRLISPTYVYGGSGTVPVSWTHFNDTEYDFDYSLVYLRTLPSSSKILLRRYTGTIGLASDHPASPPEGALDSEALVPSDFAGETSYRIIFEMTSDAGWSDEDGLYPTPYGPCGFDDVDIDGTISDFESGLDGWTAKPCDGFGSFLGVNALSNYTIEDPCTCQLSDNVLALHDDHLLHPYGQREVARSNPVDLNGVDIPGPGLLSIMASWSQYSDLPQANGVFYRPGWEYFPATCPLTGSEGWSGRVGQNTFLYVGEIASCAELRNSATVSDVPVPSNAEQVRFLYEIYASCDAFSISEESCTELTNFTPLLDNVRIEVTEIPHAPPLTLEAGHRFQDGFSQNSRMNVPGEPGNADITTNINDGDTAPIVLGDSLVVSGPMGVSPLTMGSEEPYDVLMWLQITRAGPLADSRYRDWRDKIADWQDIESGEWAFAYMDTVESGINLVPSNKYATYFREDDDDFDGSFGDNTEAQEIIPDGVLFPGTQVRYFFSGNWTNNPGNYFLLPDTAGGNALEFEILPNWRDDGGSLKHPCLLYIDAGEGEARPFVEEAFTTLGLEADRYDYFDATSNFKAPMARGASIDANNGCTLAQLMGYRGIVVNSGSRNSSLLMWPSDYVLFSDWLTAEICDGLATRQGMILNGDGIAKAMSHQGSALLVQVGATFVDDNYADYAPDENYCVRLEAPAGGGESYGTVNSSSNYEYDAYGNWCLESFAFDVLGTTGSGVGNRVYLDVEDLVTETPFAQIANEQTATDNYRTVVDGVSYHHLSSVDVIEECVGDSAHITEAAANEIQAALEWIYGVDNIPDLCEDPCEPVDAAEWSPSFSPVPRLDRALPNPFIRRVELRLNLARPGNIRLTIHDSGGRRVKALVDGPLPAGSHAFFWDGTDDRSRRLASGIYWARVWDGVQTSASKIVRLD